VKKSIVYKIQTACLIVAIVGNIAMIAGNNTDRPWLTSAGLYAGLTGLVGAMGAPLFQKVD
jgi:hypothetical protein